MPSAGIPAGIERVSGRQGRRRSSSSQLLTHNCVLPCSQPIVVLESIVSASRFSGLYRALHGPQSDKTYEKRSIRKVDVPFTASRTRMGSAGGKEVLGQAVGNRATLEAAICG